MHWSCATNTKPCWRRGTTSWPPAMLRSGISLLPGGQGARLVHSAVVTISEFVPPVCVPRALQKEKESWADEQSRLIGEQQRLALERDQAIAECDRLMAQSTDVSSEQSELSRQRQSLMSERDQLVAERQAQHTEIEKVLALVVMV